mgnify:CR=1 FL=1
MDNKAFYCSTCRATSERVYNPTLVEGYARVVFTCGAIEDHFNLKSAVVKLCKENEDEI